MYETSHNKHNCYAAGCRAIIANKYLMCQEHWAMVPGDIQKLVYDTYATRREGQRGNGAYFEAIRAAKLAVSDHIAKSAPADTVLIVGDTYEVRGKLKDIGGIWSASEKGWRVPRNMKMVAEVIVGNAPQIETLPGLDMEEDAHV